MELIVFEIIPCYFLLVSYVYAAYRSISNKKTVVKIDDGLTTSKSKTSKFSSPPQSNTNLDENQNENDFGNENDENLN